MKAGWELRAIGDFAKTSAGGTPHKAHKEYYTDGNIPWLMSGEVGQRDITHTKKFITEAGLKNSSAKLFPTNSVLVAMYGATAGEVGILRFEASTNQAVCAILPNEKFIPEYLYYALLEQKPYLISQAIGNAQPNISQKKVKSLEIPLPPLEEQKRIVAVLDEAFAALDRARENVVANLANAGEMLSALVDFEVMNSDATWTHSTIGEVVDIVGGSQPPKSEFVYEASEGLIRLIQIRDYKSDKNIVFIPRDKARRFCEPEDVMIARYGPPIFQILRGLRGAYNVALMKAVPKNVNHLSNEFLFYFLKNRPLLEYVINASSRAAGQSGVNKASLYPYPIAYPNMEKQAEICERLREHERLSALLVKNYEVQLADLYSMRQSLLERAFAGELTQASPSIAINDNERDERFSTATLVLAYEKHRLEQRHKTFGTVKAQKTLHLTESVGGLNLGRQPVVRQAGPHDQAHFDRVEAWAAQNDVFRFQQRRRGGQLGYDFIRGTNYDTFLTEAKTLLADYQAGLSRFLPLITNMNSEEAEIFTTVHAAWNNLLADGKTPSDEDIVWAAREGWHESKMDITRQKFFDAIRDIRRHDLEPDGGAKYVHGAQETLL